MLDKIRHELNYLKFDDIVSVFKFLFALIPSIIFKVYLYVSNVRIWIISEDKNEARDNGICFFRYLNSIKKSEKVYYAISSNSADYKDVESLGNIVKYGSIKHWILYLNADFNISTQKAGKPGAAVGYVLEQLGLINNKFIFLQHGITLSRARWLFYENTKMRLFICGAKPEYEYVEKEFGYPKGYISYLGFCRFDDYHHISKIKRQILLIPSWREWIGSKNEYSNVYEDTSNFENTEYYKRYQGLINNSDLCSILRENDIDLFFYPHRNMQQFVESFYTTCENIKIVNHSNSSIRELLMESALMITDYSSVALDFAYMKKPVLFYQFDVDRFREAQYEKGYFDYQTCGLGSWTDNEDELVEQIKINIMHNFTVNEDFLIAHEKYFPLYDDNNCERTYLKLQEIKNEKNSASCI